MVLKPFSDGVLDDHHPLCQNLAWSFILRRAF
jgi:hypothetical protein